MFEEGCGGADRVGLRRWGEDGIVPHAWRLLILLRRWGEVGILLLLEEGGTPPATTPTLAPSCFEVYIFQTEDVERR